MNTETATVRGKISWNSGYPGVQVRRATNGKKKPLQKKLGGSGGDCEEDRPQNAVEKIGTSNKTETKAALKRGKLTNRYENKRGSGQTLNEG